MRAAISPPARPLGVTLGGKGNQALIRRVDTAAGHLMRSRAGMLRVIVEDWLAAWEVSRGEGSMERPGCPTLDDDTQNPLHGKRVPFTGSELAALRASPKPPVDEAGVVVPFRRPE